MQPAATLTLPPMESNLPAWTTLLGGGVGITTSLGITLRKLLCDRLAIPPTYLEQRIQTILLNSHPVDDLDGILIAEGDTIALSAAMPGLAGATLRRGGHLAPMRASISRIPTQQAPGARQSGLIILKLFNLVAKEIGPQILSGEIWIRGRDLSYLRSHNIIPQTPAIEAGPDEWVRLEPTATPSRAHED